MLRGKLQFNAVNHEHVFAVPEHPADHSLNNMNVFIFRQMAPVNFDAGRRHSRILHNPLEAGNSYGILTVT
jgi:hypothetical protein